MCRDSPASPLLPPTTILFILLSTSPLVYSLIDKSIAVHNVQNRRATTVTGVQQKTFDISFFRFGRVIEKNCIIDLKGITYSIRHLK